MFNTSEIVGRDGGNFFWGQIIVLTLFGRTLQQTDLSKDRMVFGQIHIFLIMNHSNETNIKIKSDRISIKIIAFLRWVRLGLHNGGRALQLGRLGD